MKILVATHNPKKLVEIKDLLKDYPIEVYGLMDIDFDFEINEDKDTFIGNALLKAKTIQSFYPEYAILADDSGLCVDALDNQPGIYSARFMGEQTSYTIKNAHILELLKGKSNRKAMFVCAMAFLYQEKQFLTQQYVYGRISETFVDIPNSFGYDPIFIPEGHELNFALDLDTKSQISHRAKALKEVLNYVKFLQK